MAPDIDQKSQLGKVRLAVGNDASLRVGMFASATIDAKRSCGVAIPRGAVESRVEGTSVRVVRGNIVEMRRVTVGLLSDDKALVAFTGSIVLLPPRSVVAVVRGQVPPDKGPNEVPPDKGPEPSREPEGIPPSGPPEQAPAPVEAPPANAMLQSPESSPWQAR